LAKRFINDFKANHAGNPGSLSLKFGTFFGCRLDIHVSFALQLAVTWLLYFHQISGFPGFIRSTSLVLIQFACILLHEVGHVLVARGFGIKTGETTLYCMGGVSKLSRLPTTRWQQLTIAMGGPLASFLIAMVLFLVAKVTFGPNNPVSDTRIQLLMSLASANMLLGMHNLVPAFPFDGGRLLQMVLATRLRNARAIQIPSWIGQGLSIIFGLSTLVYNPALIMNAFGIFAGARQQAAVSGPAKADVATAPLPIW
jgi:Zn-dependent protease